MVCDPLLNSYLKLNSGDTRENDRMELEKEYAFHSFACLI